jgi:hypothetical protein
MCTARGRDHMYVQAKQVNCVHAHRQICTKWICRSLQTKIRDVVWSMTLQRVESLAVAGPEAMLKSPGDDQPGTNTGREGESMADVDSLWVTIGHNECAGDSGPCPSPARGVSPMGNEMPNNSDNVTAPRWILRCRPRLRSRQRMA